MSGPAPTFVHGSLDNPRAKRVRPRGASISGRLRSASDLCDEGIITAAEKGKMKDLIISEDPKINDAFDSYERGDLSRLRMLLGDPQLSKRKSSIDLMEGDLDIGALNVGSLGSDHGKFLSADDIHFFEGPFDVAAPTTESGATFSFSPYGETFGMEDAQPAEPAAPTRRFSFGSVSRLPMMSSGDKGPADAPGGGRDRLPSFGFGGLDSLGGFGSFLERDGLSGIPMEDLPLGTPPHMGHGAPIEAPNPFTTAGVPLAPPVELPSSKPSKPMPSMGSVTKPIGIPGAPSSLDRKILEQRRRQGYGSVGGEEEVDIIGGVAPMEAGMTGLLGDTSSSAAPLADSRASGSGFRIGAYSPESRAVRLDRFMAKRDQRQWKRKVKYDVRKSFADSRLRVKGRFVKKTDEELLRDLMFMV